MSDNGQIDRYGYGEFDSDVEINEIHTMDDGQILININGLGFVLPQSSIDFLRGYFETISVNLEIIDAIQNQESVAADTNFNSMSGIEFEQLTKHLVEKMGFDVQPTKVTGDGGIDLIAYNHQPFLEGKYIIQFKRWTGSIGEPTLRDLYGIMTSERANKGILVTTSHFTPAAISFAEGKPMELIDGEKLKRLLIENDLLQADKSVLTNNACEIKDYFNYAIMYEGITSNPNDTAIRCLFAETLYNALVLKYKMIDDGKNYYTELDPALNRRFYADELVKQLAILKNINFENPNKTHYLQNVYTFTEGCFEASRGNIFNALQLFLTVLNWDMLDGISSDGDDLYEFLMPIMHNVAACYNIIGLNSKSSQLFSSKIGLIEDKEWTRSELERKTNMGEDPY